MANVAPGSLSVTIDFTDPDAEELANGVDACFKSVGLDGERPVYRPLPDAMLGTPEIILTIVATALVRALLKAGLTALEEYLQERVRGGLGAKKLQVVVVGARERRFRLNFREATAEGLKSFFDEIKSALATL